MKKIISIAIVTATVALDSVAVEPETNNFANMGRGLTNLGTCFLEVPRCMVYRNSQVPFWGFVDGVVRGSGLTALRAFAGVTDVLFLGFDYGRMYNRTDFRDYVWQSPWLPPVPQPPTP